MIYKECMAIYDIGLGMLKWLTLEMMCAKNSVFNTVLALF